MFRSKVFLVENTNQLLLEFPALVKRMELKDPQFLPRLFAWIERAENLLVQNKIPQSASLSGIKAKIITPIFDTNVRANRRKVQTTIASQLMFDLQSSLQDAIHASSIKVEQASESINQLLSVLAQSSADNGHTLEYVNNEDIGVFVDRIWYVICHHEQLKNSAVQLKGLLSENDIKLLITRDIDVSQFMSETATPVGSLLPS
jgi:hypothetical protein